MAVVTLRSCLLLALVVSAALAAPKGNKQKDQKKGIIVSFYSIVSFYPENSSCGMQMK